MKRKNAGEFECRGSSSILTYVKIFVVYPTLLVLVFSALLAPFAAGILLRIVAASIGGALESIGSLLTLIFWGGTCVAYLIWFLLTGEWVQFVTLLPGFLDWIRSVVP